MNTGSAHLGERRTFWTLLCIAAVAMLGWSCWRTELAPWRLFERDALARTGDLLSGFLPPLLTGDFLLTTARGAAETMAVAVLGTVLALMVGIPCGILASRAVMVAPRFASSWRRVTVAHHLMAWTFRLLTALTRSIPEVVWAVILVRVVGLGPTAGVIALGIAYGGMIAKVTAEQLENAEPAPAAALADLGSGRLGTLLWAQLPMATPGLTDYALYRFECAVRASALMGYVGGGGLGFQIEHSYGYSHYHEVTTQVLMLVALVALVELSADRLRRWYA